MSRRPPFCNFLTASGHGEIWDHTDEKKFKQFGWRCTTNETEFSHGTLIGNWNEERFDTRSIAKRRPLPSQVAYLDVHIMKSSLFITYIAVLGVLTDIYYHSDGVKSTNVSIASYCK